MPAARRPRRRPSADRALTAWTTGLSLGGVLPQYLVASLAVGMRGDFSLSEAELGAAAGVAFGVAALVSPLAARLVGRIGLRAGVALGATLVGGSALATGLFADSAAAVIALMAVNGIGSGIGSPTYAALLAAGVRLERQGRAFGMLTSAPQVAAFAAGLALPLVAVPFGWRVAFVVPSVISAVCLAALFAGGRLTGGGRPPAPPPDPALARRLRSIHAIALAAALAGAAVMGMRSFLVVFAVSAGFDAVAAGLLLSATGLVALVSRLGLGILGDRRPGDSLLRAAALMGLCAFGFVLMAAGGDTLVVLGALLAGGLAWGWHAPLSLAVITLHPRGTGRAIGIQMSGFFLGALVGPLAVGLLAQHGGYQEAWVLCCFLALAAGAVALLARRLEPG